MIIGRNSVSDVRQLYFIVGTAQRASNELFINASIQMERFGINL